MERRIETYRQSWQCDERKCQHCLTYLQANAKKYDIDPEIFKRKIFISCARRCSAKRWAQCRHYHDDRTGLIHYRQEDKTLPGHDGRNYPERYCLPVGGIKEKVLAAKRAGLKELIMCWQNEKDVEEINPEFIKGIKFHYVKTMQQVLELALV